MSFIFTYSRDALTVFLNGVPTTVNNTHPKWDDIFNIISGKVTATPEELTKLIDTRAAIKEAVAGAKFGRVTVGYDSILLDGKPVHSHLTARMIELLKGGFDIAPWARFMDRLYANPSKTAVDELYLWLEKSNMPITEDGRFLAYKKVNSDYTSFHCNADGTKFQNPIGQMVSMPRNEVDDNRNRTCSQGLHFCSYHYLPNYHGGRGRVLILEIDPADVVSIPSDYDNAKGRAWRYLIRGEVQEKKTETFYDDTPLVADSDFHEEWNEDGYDEDYDLHFNSNGFVTDIDELQSGIKAGNWTPEEVPTATTDNVAGAVFEVNMNDGYDLYLTVYFDASMQVIAAKKVS